MIHLNAARQWLQKYASKLLNIGIVLIWALLLAHKVIPDYIPHALALSLSEAIIVSMFLFTVERLVELEEKVEHIGKGAHAGILIGSERVEGNRQVVRLLGSFPEQCLDLLQFSGYAAAELMREVVQTFHGTTVRLLIAAEDNTARYDAPTFHEKNVKATYQILKVINSQQPGATFAVWRYAVHPVMSGVVVGSRLASVSWYRAYPVVGHELPVLRGHNQPTVTATAEGAPALVAMARAQFDAMLNHPSTELIVAFGPKAAQVVDRWLQVITKDLPDEQRLGVTNRERQKIKNAIDSDDLLEW